MKINTEKTYAILLIEDNSDDIFLIELACQESFNKPKIHAINNGRLALEYLNDLPSDKNKKPDLIILDINLPILNGLELLKEIKLKEITRSIPIVVFTSSDANSDMKYCYENGVDFFIRKPNNIDEFRRVMKFIKEHCFSFPLNFL